MKPLAAGCLVALLLAVASPAPAQDEPPDHADDATQAPPAAPAPAETAPAGPSAEAGEEPEAAEAPAPGGEVAASLAAVVEVERQILDGLARERLDNLDAQRSAAIEQARSNTGVASATRSLSAARSSRKDLAAAREALDAAEDDLARSNEALASLVRRGEVLRGLLVQTSSRLELLTAALEEARARGAGATLPPLAGAWDVTLAPTGDHGVFRFAQSGTIVGGTYTLASGHAGSFQGTFVDGRLQVERVDAKAGRDVTFYGLLGDDGVTLKGTWESRLLGTGQPAFGQWTARKRLPKPPSPEQ